MSENQEEEYAAARQEIEKLRSQNSKLREDWLEATDALLSYTGLPGQMHRIDVEIKQLKSLLIRAADALENEPSKTHLQLVQELRKGGGVNYRPPKGGLGLLLRPKTASLFGRLATRISVKFHAV